MPVFIPAQATCDQCGKTAPCWLACILDDSIGVGNFGASIRGLATWFWKNDGVACSGACKEALARNPKFARLSGAWTPCGE
jgi:hypothetical protein